MEKYSFKNRSYRVLGLGKSGLAALDFIQKRGGHGEGWDDIPQAREKAQSLGYILREPDKVTWATLSGLVVSPGIPLTYPAPHPEILRAAQEQVPLMNDIEIFYKENAAAIYVGITGTNGKSTTTHLIHFLLTQAGKPCEMGGNVGIPILSLPCDSHKTYVLELSSFQLDLMKEMSFHVAVFLNLSPDHLDRHGSLEAYGAAKRRLLDMQKEGAWASIVGVDDPFTRSLYETLKKEKGRSPLLIPFSTQGFVEGGVYAEDGWIIDHRQEQKKKILRIQEMTTLPGIHNLQNALAAVAVGLVFSLGEKSLQEGLRQFPGVAHRQERVGEKEGILVVNDSKATNVDAVIRAFQVYDNLYWIAGGSWKGDDLRLLLPYASKIRHGYFIGKSGPVFQSTFQGAFPVTLSETLDRAVSQAFQDAQGRGPSVILLSPACASYDQFENFEHRGQVFKNLSQTYL